MVRSQGGRDGAERVRSLRGKREESREKREERRETDKHHLDKPRPGRRRETNTNRNAHSEAKPQANKNTKASHCKASHWCPRRLPQSALLLTAATAAAVRAAPYNGTEARGNREESRDKREEIMSRVGDSTHRIEASQDQDDQEKR